MVVVAPGVAMVVAVVTLCGRRCYQCYPAKHSQGHFASRALRYDLGELLLCPCVGPPLENLTVYVSFLIKTSVAASCSQPARSPYDMPIENVSAISNKLLLLLAERP